MAGPRGVERRRRNVFDEDDPASNAALEAGNHNLATLLDDFLLGKT